MKFDTTKLNIVTGAQDMIKGLHHAAYRCKRSEETRAFYEDFLGLPLAGAITIDVTKTGRPTSVLHTFYQLQNGAYIAFFEAPDMPYNFVKQHYFDLHIALEVSKDKLQEMLIKGKTSKIETRGPSDHGFIRSIYFRDPNGYVIELASKTAQHEDHLFPNNEKARQVLLKWTDRESSSKT